ncbi:MAG: sugar ABC transporter ATP-binding protein [Candidatus Humimicrobiaceae bacterium]
MADKNNDYILKAVNISKHYPGVIALDQINFDLKKGEVHALIGENGAGKTTLSKIFAGEINKDGGCIYKDGVEIEMKNSRDSQNFGISIVDQEFNLINSLSIDENILIGREPLLFRFFIKSAECKNNAKIILKDLDFNIPLNKKIKYLSIADRQLVQISKALSYKAEILIMDEPTASLGKDEIKKLFIIINKLKNNGKSIIYISHKLEEILEIADRITILRDGRLIKTIENNNRTTKEELINLMIGRDISKMYVNNFSTLKEKVVLEVKNLNKINVLENISFFLKEGEILGISGLIGAGRTELARCIFGLDSFNSGEIIINGRSVKKPKPYLMSQLGIGYVTEDRKIEGIIKNMSIRNNITLGNLNFLSRLGLIKNSLEVKVSNKEIKDLGIKCSNLSQLVGKLSGGNQQKVIIAKWMISDKIKVLIMDEPSRGIDIGAKAEIYHLMAELCERGISIIMISSELAEIIGMCDRVLVMRKGKINSELLKCDLSEQRILEIAMFDKKEDKN